jgi:hypothetical protein
VFYYDVAGVTCTRVFVDAMLERVAYMKYGDTHDGLDGIFETLIFQRSSRRQLFGLSIVR